MPAVEHPDTDGDGEVKGPLAGEEGELLDGRFPEAQAAGGDVGCGGGLGLLDRRRGAVDAQDLGAAGAEGARQGPRAAADLEDAEARAEGAAPQARPAGAGTGRA
jgi:hypothetical protein